MIHLLLIQLIIFLYFFLKFTKLIIFLLSGDADWCKFSIKITDQELAMAKLSGFREWLSIHPVIAEPDADEDTERNSSSHKMIIFAHHHKVLDAVQVRDIWLAKTDTHS